ncbi:MAG: DUF2577 family protein [Oscillospiraceae bacterium]|nr:DUF2577 family protein [Oscillospiraceae bacterium]
MNNGIADMIAAMSRANSPRGEGCELIYATWLGDRLRVDSLPIDIPAEMVDIDTSLLEHSVIVSIETAAPRTECGTITIKQQEMKIAARLKAGDKVFAIKMRGGERYAVIGIYCSAM